MTIFKEKLTNASFGFQNSFIKALLLSFFFILVGVIYNQGTSGDLFYDDLSFLGPLEQIESSADAQQFLDDGNAGPLKRPIALASFLLHAENWPDSSQLARQINVLIHLINGLLLFGIAYQLLRLRQDFQPNKIFWVAAMGTALWLALPLLVSTTLITVQRWTGLSALFGLIGLNLFLAGYFFQSQKPFNALILQAGGLGFFTLLSIFTKESGALYPIYALVIHTVLINQPTQQTNQAPRWLANGRTLVLCGLCIALLIYLSPLMRDWFAVSSYRGWSSYERLQTQFVLLWHYLQLAFIPNIGIYGPFHDDITLITGTRAWLALAAFILVTLIAFSIRRRSAWVLFALLWFFTGHLIESTVIHVELKFEHLNYIAVFGFCLMLSVLAWKAFGSLQRVMPALLGLYILLMLGALHATTSIWGNSMEAAENWVQRHPASPRAIMHLSTVYQRELGNPSYSMLVLDRSAPHCPDCLDIRMQALLFQCGSDDYEEITRRFDEMIALARDSRPSIALLDSFYPMQEFLDTNACPPLTLENMYHLTEQLLENPGYTDWRYQVHLRFHAAYFAKELGEIDKALQHLEVAENLQPNVMPIMLMQVHLLLEQQAFETALEKVNTRTELTNRNRFMSDEALQKLKDSIREAELESRVMDN